MSRSIGLFALAKALPTEEVLTSARNLRRSDSCLYVRMCAVWHSRLKSSNYVVRRFEISSMLSY